MTQPPYGPRGPSGRPPEPPEKNNLVPWLIVGGAVLLSALGLLLVLLLRGDRTTGTHAEAAIATAPSVPSSTPAKAHHRDLPGGAQVAEETTSAGQARYPGSADAALGWVQAMADGDFQTAYDLSCADVQRSATEAAAGEDPAWTLGTYFFEQTLSGNGFTDGTFDSLIYSQDADSDIATFTLHLDSGEEFVLLVYVQADGTVCDFV